MKIVKIECFPSVLRRCHFRTASEEVRAGGSAIVVLELPNSRDTRDSILFGTHFLVG